VVVVPYSKWKVVTLELGPTRPFSVALVAFTELAALVDPVGAWTIVTTPRLPVGLGLAPPSPSSQQPLLFKPETPPETSIEPTSSSVRYWMATRPPPPPSPQQPPAPPSPPAALRRPARRRRG
jgi:hypothetical protein